MAARQGCDHARLSIGRNRGVIARAGCADGSSGVRSFLREFRCVSRENLDRRIQRGAGLPVFVPMSPGGRDVCELVPVSFRTRGFLGFRRVVDKSQSAAVENLGAVALQDFLAVPAGRSASRRDDFHHRIHRGGFSEFKLGRERGGLDQHTSPAVALRADSEVSLSVFHESGSSEAQPFAVAMRVMFLRITSVE